MRTSKTILSKFRRVTMSSLLVLAWMLPSTSYANGTPKPPPPPPPPPPATPSDTPAPTNTPEPTDTDEPTDAPEPTATVRASNTPLSTATSNPAVTAVPSQTPPRASQDQEPATNPDCQSSVQGVVIGSSGQGVAGATVLIEGEGWSSRIMTDDSGQYGFAGLCAGTATLNAVLSSGQAGQGASITLNGRDGMQVNLSAAPNQATVAATATATATIAQQTATPEPDLPATGYSGWLLAGAALLGLLLLLSAGVRRVLGERTQDQN